MGWFWEETLPTLFRLADNKSARFCAYEEWVIYYLSGQSCRKAIVFHGWSFSRLETVLRGLLGAELIHMYQQLLPPISNKCSRWNLIYSTIELRGSWVGLRSIRSWRLTYGYMPQWCGIRRYPISPWIRPRNVQSWSMIWISKVNDKV